MATNAITSMLTSLRTSSRRIYEMPVGEKFALITFIAHGALTLVSCYYSPICFLGSWFICTAFNIVYSTNHPYIGLANLTISSYILYTSPYFNLLSVLYLAASLGCLGLTIAFMPQ